MNYVSYDDFKKMDMRLGHIQHVEPIEGTDKLLRFEIDFGAMTDQESLPFDKEAYRNRDVRQIVSGVREFFPEYEQLVGQYGLYILNLEPREIRGVMSHGMLMAVDGIDGKPVFLGPQSAVEPGAKVR